ncbi:MAG TPA: 23S rRNA pseudouridine(1911/1915/1917) synthase RluD [Buchnera sp. (in: enterobacteria)]|nr:23S rRNA pseudouridine(1911/1915/1917) synthase RluD [Buchnera sp. (in: enterobacteria)]
MITEQKLSAYFPFSGKIKKRLDQGLSEVFCKYSRTILKKWIINGQVSINNHIVTNPKKKFLGGELITIQIIVKKNILLSENIFLNVIYEEDDFLIINKPMGLIVHPGAGNPNGTLLNALLHRDKIFSHIPRAGIVHRLDKNTTGLILVSKNINTYNTFVDLLKKREIYRIYEGIVIGRMISGGTVNAPIGRHRVKRTKMTVTSIGKSAITHYRIIERFKNHTHVKIQLETGRTHQIRVHMLHIMYPLVGDTIYSSCFSTPKNISKELLDYLIRFPRQALHATSLRFNHPYTKKTMHFNIECSKDIKTLIHFLKTK